MLKLNNKNIIALIGLLIFSPVTIAATFNLGEINGCLAAAKKTKEDTDFLKIEELLYKKEIIYEIEARDHKGVVWEFECRAEGGGTIFKVTREVESTSDPLFKEAGGVSEEDARAKALAEYPGTLIETEYERVIPGNALYEFDIIGKHGQIHRVEVSAVSGEIIDVLLEEWEISWESH
jgi:uncharacterized membrane protein YkoI